MGQRPLTRELLEQLAVNGFWEAFLGNVMGSQTTDIQRMAIYLVSLFLQIGWVEMFATYLQFIVAWMHIQEIANEVLTFVVQCSVFPQAAALVCQIGLLEYFQELASDPDFGAQAAALLDNVRRLGI
jgi:hypothetical protein